MIIDQKHSNGMKITRRGSSKNTAPESEALLEKIADLSDRLKTIEKKSQSVVFMPSPQPTTEVGSESERNIINITVPEIKMPEINFPKDEPDPKAWKFVISRDDRGNLKEITATAI